MAKLSEQPIDVTFLDATVNAVYYGSKQERMDADHILRDLQNNPDTWFQVLHILSTTHNLNTKFFALQVLEAVIKYRWNTLPVEQRDGIKNYISQVIVKLSSDEISFRQDKFVVRALQHRSIDISLELTGIGADGRRRSWPVQMFNLN